MSAQDQVRWAISAGDWEQAAALGEAAMSEGTVSRGVMQQLAKGCFDAGLCASALPWAQRLTCVDPHNARYWHALGMIRRKLGDFDGAFEAQRAALAIAPGHEEAHRERAKIARDVRRQQADALSVPSTVAEGTPGAARRDEGDVLVVVLDEGDLVRPARGAFSRDGRMPWAVAAIVAVVLLFWVLSIARFVREQRELERKEARERQAKLERESQLGQERAQRALAEQQRREQEKQQREQERARQAGEEENRRVLAEVARQQEAAEQQKRVLEKEQRRQQSAVGDGWQRAMGNLWTGVTLYYGSGQYRNAVGRVLGGNDHCRDPWSGQTFRGVCVEIRGVPSWKDRNAMILGDWWVRSDDPALRAMRWVVLPYVPE